MNRPDRRSWPRWARALTSGWVLSPLLVVALLLGAFFGYGAYTRSQPTHYARGGDFLLDTNPTPGESTGPKVKGSTQARGSDGRVTEPASRSGTPQTSRPLTGTHGGGGNGGGGTGDGGSTGTTPTGPAPTTGSGVVTPATGTYGLDVSGSERVKFGPFGACHKSFPSHADLAVAQASGESGSSYDFDLRLYPNDPGKHDERHIYQYGDDAISLSFEQATVTCAGVKQSTTVDYSPTQRRVELPLEVGAAWSSKGGDGERTETARSSVTDRTHLTVQGRSYEVYVIDTHVTMSGSESGTRTQRWWYAPALGVPLKWHEELNASRKGGTYTSSLTCTVVTLP